MLLKACLFRLKMMKCGKNTIKFGMRLKINSEPVYEHKYLKVKVREFNGVIKLNFLGNDMTKKYTLYLHNIACVTIDSVLKIDK